MLKRFEEYEVNREDSGIHLLTLAAYLLTPHARRLSSHHLA
jgi:hypothetical protein